jgi:tetratricopeptide (TPR) repeat protein
VSGAGVRAALAGLALSLLSLGAPHFALAQVSEADVFVAEAVLAIDDKQWDRALELLRQALARSPGHVEALYYTGVAYLGKRQPAAAVPPLTQASQAAPSDTSIAYQLGLAYFALEQYDRAAPCSSPSSRVSRRSPRSATTSGSSAIARTSTRKRYARSGPAARRTPTSPT